MQVVKWMKASTALVSAAAAAMTLGCSPQPMTPAAAVNDRFYPVTPDAMTVKAGIVSGQVTDMKVMERVEAGSGRITAPAKLTAKLVIKNVSADQAVRLLGAKITYIDHKGLPIVLEENRTAPLLKLAPSYGSSDRLDPGQDATHAIDVEFPVEALKAKRLKDIRLDLAYIPSSYKEQVLNFPVSIGGQ